MPTKHIESSISQSSFAKETDGIILLLENNRKLIIEEWVEAVRAEFNQPESTTDKQIADHMLYILEAIIAEFKQFETDPSRSKSYKQGDMRYDEGKVEDEKDGGHEHGKQRAGIDAYNADKVYWEYVLFRKIIVQFLQKHRQLDIDHLEIITCVIESCGRDSLITFSDTLQNVQRKLLGTIVHDIRCPLSTISMMAEYIAMTGNTDKSSEFANKIVSISGRIGDMLAEMLSTLSTEAGQGVELNFENHNLNNILSASENEFQIAYAQRLKVILPAEPVQGIFDAQMINRVLENLISNASKYGDLESDITITVTQSPSFFMLDVHNFGTPIEQTRHEEIFQFLKLFDNKESHKVRSWGIGLAFVKAVVEGHKGNISLTSDPIEGTRFKLSIPKLAFNQGESKIVPI
jgi:signal transduction histidine kinase